VAFALRNTTAATSGSKQQYSPGLYFRGQNWKSGAANQIGEFLFQERGAVDTDAHGIELLERTGASGSWNSFVKFYYGAHGVTYDSYFSVQEGTSSPVYICGVYTDATLGSNAFCGASTNHKFAIRTNNTTAVYWDTSQAAFFSGDISGLTSGSATMKWDATNKRLGVGTASPAITLDIIGGARFTGSEAASSGTSTELGYSSGGPHGYFQAYDRTNGRYKAISIGNSLWVDADPAGSSSRGRNIALSTSSTIGGITFGGAVGAFFIGNATTDPTSNPTAGGLLYVSSGALKYRGSSGTVTTIANA
jgi:hypothetical protein